MMRALANYCSFCNRAESHVGRLIVGSTATICDECIMSQAETLATIPPEASLTNSGCAEARFWLGKSEVSSLSEMLRLAGLHLDKPYSGLELHAAFTGALAALVIDTKQAAGSAGKAEWLRLHIATLQSQSVDMLEPKLAHLRAELARNS